MEGLTADTKKGRYISIISDGKFHEKVTEGTEGAVLRTYEFKDKKTGEKVSGSKWELVYQKVENVMVTNVEFETGEYGENLLITLSDGENEIVLAQGTATPFGEDLMKKLPAVNFAEKVTIQPYSFPSEKSGKPVRGVNIYQTSDKVLSHFWDGEKAVNGIPEVDESAYETFTSDEWRAHFLNVRIFLTKYNKEHVVTKFNGVDPLEDEFKKKVADDDIKPEDIPFD